MRRVRVGSPHGVLAGEVVEGVVVVAAPDARGDRGSEPQGPLRIEPLDPDTLALSNIFAAAGVVPKAVMRRLTW